MTDDRRTSLKSFITTSWEKHRKCKIPIAFAEGLK